jgi:uncharacterized membrane protein
LKTPLRNLHLALGLLGIVVFLLTGQHMRYNIHHLMEADERLRFSLRGNHIYILLSALMNLCLGAYLRASLVRWRAYAQLVGSLLVVAATVLIVAAFFFESKASLERPYTHLAVESALAGALLHVVAAARDVGKG